MSKDLLELDSSDFPVEIDGRFRLLGILGDGAMGRVFHARTRGEHGFKMDVALKVMVLGDLRHAKRQQRAFEREVRIGGLLNHPNIAQTFDSGRLGHYSYLVLEWVDGITLDALIKKGGPLRGNALLDVLEAASVGLHHAHRARQAGEPLNVVHRDLKPSNVMVRYDGVVKVLDFGIAKAELEGLEASTTLAKGTPSFMSPEQLAGEAVDGRSDLFALGSLAYFLATGGIVFAGRSMESVLLKILHVDETVVKRAVFERADAAMVGLGDLLRRLLVKDISRRFDTASEVATAVRAMRKSVAGTPGLLEVLAERYPDEVARVWGPTGSDSEEGPAKQLSSASVQSGYVVTPSRPAPAPGAGPRIGPTRPQAPLVSGALAGADATRAMRPPKRFRAPGAVQLGLLVFCLGLVALLLWPDPPTKNTATDDHELPSPPEAEGGGDAVVVTSLVDLYLASTTPSDQEPIASGAEPAEQTGSDRRGARVTPVEEELSADDSLAADEAGEIGGTSAKRDRSAKSFGATTNGMAGQTIVKEEAKKAAGGPSHKAEAATARPRLRRPLQQAGVLGQLSSGADSGRDDAALDGIAALEAAAEPALHPIEDLLAQFKAASASPSRSSLLAACRDGRIRRLFKSGGEVYASFTVQPDGRVTDVSARADWMDREALECVSRQLSGVRLPSPPADPLAVSDASLSIAPVSTQTVEHMVCVQFQQEGYPDPKGQARLGVYGDFFQAMPANRPDQLNCATSKRTKAFHPVQAVAGSFLVEVITQQRFKTFSVGPPPAQSVKITLKPDLRSSPHDLVVTVILDPRGAVEKASYHSYGMARAD